SQQPRPARNTQSLGSLHMPAGWSRRSPTAQVPSSQRGNRWGFGQAMHSGQPIGVGHSACWNAASCSACTLARSPASGVAQLGQHPGCGSTPSPGPWHAPTPPPEVVPVVVVVVVVVALAPPAPAPSPPAPSTIVVPPQAPKISSVAPRPPPRPQK